MAQKNSEFSAFEALGEVETRRRVDKGVFNERYMAAATRWLGIRERRAQEKIDAAQAEHTDIARSATDAAWEAASAAQQANKIAIAALVAAVIAIIVSVVSLVVGGG